MKATVWVNLARYSLNACGEVGSDVFSTTTVIMRYFMIKWKQSHRIHVPHIFEDVLARQLLYILTEFRVPRLTRVTRLTQLLPAAK